MSPDTIYRSEGSFSNWRGLETKESILFIYSYTVIGGLSIIIVTAILVVFSIFTSTFSIFTFMYYVIFLTIFIM